MILTAPMKLTIGCVAAFAGGASLGAYGMKLHCDKIYERDIEQEINNAKSYYKRLYKREEFADLVELGGITVVDDMVSDLQYISEAVDAVDDELELTKMTEVVKNVFTDAKVVGNFNIEDEDRSGERPYILTHDEFFNSDRNSRTLTYFEGDGVLSDESDEHVRDIDELVGEHNLLRFGHGSKDNNVVYICNEDLDVNFEVIRSQGKYAEEVLGFIEHSEKRRPPKFRRDDE